MEPHPSPLSDQAAGLCSNAQAPREDRALLPAALHTLIAAVLARLFDRLEQLLQAWLAGTLAPPPARNNTPHTSNPTPRQRRPAIRAPRRAPSRAITPKIPTNRAQTVGRISEAPSDSPRGRPPYPRPNRPPSRPRQARDPPRPTAKTPKREAEKLRFYYSDMEI